MYYRKGSRIDTGSAEKLQDHLISLVSLGVLLVKITSQSEMDSPGKNHLIKSSPQGSETF